MRRNSDQWAWMVFAAVMALGLVTPPAQAEALLPDQLLERVGAVSPGAVVDMSFRDTTLIPQFEAPVDTTNVSACQLTATAGLFCLDASGPNKGRVVRQWNPVETGQDRVLFSCEDRAFGFDRRASETCTALAVGDDQSIWVAGKKKNNYSLVKVVAKPKDPDSPGYLPCAEDWIDLQDEPAAQYCFKEIAKDRPLLVDATAAKVLLPGGLDCTGVMALELRRTLMFFADPDLNPADSDCLKTGLPPGSFTIADSKGWGLRGSEKLQGVGLFRLQEAESSYALGVSTNGRILAKDTAGADVATDVFNIPAQRESRGTLFEPGVCVAADIDNQYGIRSGEKSGNVVVTDYNWCEVMVLEPTTEERNPTLGLQNVVVDGADLTLSTRECPYSIDPTSGDPCTSSVSYPPLQPTLAPGDSIDLSKCSGPCPWARDDTGELAAVASKVKLVSTETGATLFQIVDIPDCRWLKQDFGDGDEVPAICDQEGVIVGGNGSAETQSLDVSKVLPKQVLDQFASNPLPPMLMSPEYRAQVRGIPASDPNGPVNPRYYFDAFFVILEDGVVFTDTYEIEFFVDRLSKSSLGCTASYPSNEWPVSIGRLLQWDIALRISEKIETVLGPDADELPGPDLGYGDILGNIDCGSTKKGGASMSLLIFNAELTDGSEVVFARQVKSLFYDLYWSLAKTACARVESDGNRANTKPFSATTCTALSNQWESARDKLSKCLLAADAPKQSEAIRNCQSFNSQLENYLAIVTETPACTDFASCTDRANRRGDQIVRTMVLKHMFNDRFLPSVPGNGFADPDYDVIKVLPPLPRL